jgi:hypothetical protein
MYRCPVAEALTDFVHGVKMVKVGKNNCFDSFYNEDICFDFKS